MLKSPHSKWKQTSMQTERTHVVVGVIVNNEGKFCLALRPAHVHLGGFWEFPGGKLEQGESSLDGLKRELFEELGIEVLSAKAFMSLPYDYPTKQVYLDFWLVDAFKGEPYGKEGQPVKWLTKAELLSHKTPPACQPVVDALTRQE
jgi:8-oxo-dGTP diphosphatase